MYMGGRQISNRQEEVHKREELKIKQWINRKSANTDVSITVLLVNALIFIIIGTLREDPLSTGMFDVFFGEN